MSGGDLISSRLSGRLIRNLPWKARNQHFPGASSAPSGRIASSCERVLNDIASGAPKLVEELFSDHPESAKTLTTQAMDRLAELDNERFSNYVAKSAVSYLQAQGIAVEFAVLNEFLPSIPDFPRKNRFVQAIQKMYAAVSGLETIAAKQIPNPGGKTVCPDHQGGDIERASVLRYEWNHPLARLTALCVIPEMAPSSGTRKVTLTEQEKKEIKAGVREEFEARLSATPRYGEAMRGYLKSGNQRAYNERATSEGQKLLPRHRCTPHERRY